MIDGATVTSRHLNKHIDYGTLAGDPGFDPLAKDQVSAIVRQQIERVAKRLTDRKIGLEVSERAVQLLSDTGYDPAFGARPVKRAVQSLLETTVAQAILRGDVAEDQIACVDVADAADESAKPLIITAKAASAKSSPTSSSTSSIAAS